MSLIENLHGGYVAGRRARRLASLLADLLPAGADVLDVGCGDGQIAALVSELRDDVVMRGIDLQVRPDTWVPVTAFDGQHIPLDDNGVDAIMLIDVLHHTEDPLILLREANRVAREVILIKDHLRDGFLAGPTLRFMDRVGNCRHGVALPYCYWKHHNWTDAFAQLGLEVECWEQKLRLYPGPARLVFERNLHFLTRLRVAPTTATAPTADVLPKGTV